jgi:hypothetical protein
VQLSRGLARRCRCAELQLGREATDLLRLLDGVRPRPTVFPITVAVPTGSLRLTTAALPARPLTRAG